MTATLIAQINVSLDGYIEDENHEIDWQFLDAEYDEFGRRSPPPRQLVWYRPDHGMALIFIAAGLIGLTVTLLAFRSRGYQRLSTYYSCGDEVATDSADGSPSDEPARPAAKGMSKGSWRPSAS